MPIKAVKVIDFDKKIDIWENANGNSSASKLSQMKIDYDKKRFDATVAYARGIIGEDYKDIQDLADTFTYQHEILGGYEKETFEDIPYIIPYIVDGSQDLVIVLSGGGFAYKTIDGSDSGGKRVADRLNARGISCMLLHYRSNPYKFPIPMLDLQRAIRFSKYKASDFGYSPDRISLLGFSSGGYIVASYINQYMGKDHFDSGYMADEIDRMDDKVIAAAMIYAPFTFEYNKPMIHAVYPYEDIQDEEKRSQLFESLDLKNKIEAVAIPHFISYSSGDRTINYKGTEAYIRALKDKRGNVTRIFVANQDHGYSDDLYIDEYEKWIKSL